MLADGRLVAVKSFLDASMGRRTAPKALGVAVVRRGAPVWSEIFGAGEETRFQAGSISKSITAAVALQLVAQGELALDEDVNERLTSWRLGHPTTLRSLLGHTAGTNVPFYAGYEQGDELPSLLDSLEGRPPASTPKIAVDLGRRGSFAYSGAGYTVVQQLVEDVTRTSLEVAARRLVLDPVGMDQSTFRQPLPSDWLPCAARADWHLYPEASAAGLWTTPLDLAKLIVAIQVAREEPSAQGISAAAAEAMLAKHSSLPKRGEWSLLPWLGLRAPHSAGLGLFLMDDQRFANIGGAYQFFSMLVGSADAGAVVMSASGVHPLIFQTLQSISDAEGWSGFRVQGRMKKLFSAVALRTLWLKKPG